jgi:hypothetical protein
MKDECQVRLVVAKFSEVHCSARGISITFARKSFTFISITLSLYLTPFIEYPLHFFALEADRKDCSCRLYSHGFDVHVL